MKPFNFTVPDLKALYSQRYDAEMTRWRLLGASDKAEHIEMMFKSMGKRIETVLEVGCGTGAVLEQLAARRVGSTHTGIEIGEERSGTYNGALEGACTNNVTVLGYDGKRIPFADASVDLVYATHVLEHVTDERSFLHELRRVARHFVYVEVPCELHLRTSYNALQESLSIGHINAYSVRSFVLTLETSGLRVLKVNVFDHSYRIRRFHCGLWNAVIKTALRRSLLGINGYLASQLFTYHVGAICEKSVPLNLP
jgi:ubiquinone/menaquinone biosynthesis C-methylase UbiE